jgi:hypothetical protein
MVRTLLELMLRVPVAAVLAVLPVVTRGNGGLVAGPCGLDDLPLPRLTLLLTRSRGSGMRRIAPRPHQICSVVSVKEDEEWGKVSECIASVCQY